MILTDSQAKQVKEAMLSMQSVGEKGFFMSFGAFLRVKEMPSGTIYVSHDTRGVTLENYTNLASFSTAYNLD